MPYRVFISYAHDDDEPPIDGVGEGFVSELMRRVKHYLKIKGPSPEFFRDVYAIRKSNAFTPKIERELQDADALMIVLSRNWLESEYCNHELQLFRTQRAQESVERLQARVLLVSKEFVPIERLPALLRDRDGRKYQDSHAFYREHPELPTFIEYFAEGEKEQSPAFRTAAKDLADDLRERTATGAPSPQPVFSPSPPTAPSAPSRNARRIFLAKPADDMLEAYVRLVNELQGRSYEVTPPPNEEIPRDTSAKSFVQEALRGAEVSIHVVGESKGYAPSDEDYIVPLQLRLAKEYAAASTSDPPFQRIIWAPRTMSASNGAAPPTRDALKVMERFGTFDGDKIEGCDLGDFIEQIIVGHLSEIAPPVPFPQPDAPSADATTTYYVWANEKDVPYGLELAAALEQLNVVPVPPVYDVDPDERLRWQEEQLATCDGVVIPWASASTVWVRSQSDLLKKWKNLKRDKPFARRGVVAGPPSGIDKTAFKRLPPRQAIDVVVDLTDRESISPDALGPLFGEGS